MLPGRQCVDVEKQAEGWWIIGIPDAPDAGPYDRKADAESDRRGLRRFFQHEHERAFFTIDRPGSNGMSKT